MTFYLGVDFHPRTETVSWVNLETGETDTVTLRHEDPEVVRAFYQRVCQPPAVIVLDLDHSEDPTHGQQEFSFYNHYDGHHGYLPLFLFEGLSGQVITAALRPGQRPTGAENAMIVRRVLKRRRAAWPQTRIILRGDAHFANPEWRQLAMADPQRDFLFGLAGHRALSPWAEPFLAPPPPSS